jgi:hypothetical protein
LLLADKLDGAAKVTSSRSKPVDLCFGPTAPAALESNWIKTIAMFRLYGPLEQLFDGTWKLNNEKTN